MKPAQITLENAKTGVVFAEVTEAMDHTGEIAEIPGSLFKIVRVIPASDRSVACIEAVCVNYADTAGEPLYFALPFQCYPQQ